MQQIWGAFPNTTVVTSSIVTIEFNGTCYRSYLAKLLGVSSRIQVKCLLLTVTVMTAGFSGWFWGSYGALCLVWVWVCWPRCHYSPRVYSVSSVVWTLSPLSGEHVEKKSTTYEHQFTVNSCGLQPLTGASQSFILLRLHKVHHHKIWDNYSQTKKLGWE